MLTLLLKVIFVMIATGAFNNRPVDNPPRYWSTYEIDFDSLAKVAAHKTDSALGVREYSEEMEKLKASLK